MMKSRMLFLALGLLLFPALLMAGYLLEPAPATGRDALKKAFEAGNFNDAYLGFRKLLLEPQPGSENTAEDLTLAVQSLQRLGRQNEIDELLEATIAAQPDRWRMLVAVAEEYSRLEHFGFIIAGKFERGRHRGGGNVVNSTARDRVRSLQLLQQAWQKLPADFPPAERASFLLRWGDIWLNTTEAWRLQVLTDLEKLPDYEPGWGYGRNQIGAPVNADDTPVYYSVPASYEAAQNDGQRWRWCLAEAARVDAKLASAADLRLADFLVRQFGVETIREFGYQIPRVELDEKAAGDKQATGVFALDTLSDDETIAKLATGIRRFKLPEEFNYIRIYQRVADRNEPDSSLTALQRLASVYLNRRQYPRAAEYFRAAIKIASGDHKKQLEQQLDQIVGNFGRFESVSTQPAGKGASVEFVFRNGKAVSFTAQEIRVAQLLNDVKAYLRGNPRQLDWSQIDVGELGHRLLRENQQKYLGRQVANWQLDLEPRPNHFDRRITIATPLQKPGAYWVTAKMADGNTNQIVLWVADTVLAQKPIDAGTYYLVADAVTGAPVARANVEFFGFRSVVEQNRVPRIESKNFAEFSDENGQVLVKPEAKLGNVANQFQWLVIARTDAGRLAYLGFNGIWTGRTSVDIYDATKALAVTDRPVYRPKDTVKFKIWVAQAKYDQPEQSPFAGKDFVVEIQNPRGEKVLEKSYKADNFGGLTGEFPLGSDAKLGSYQIFVQGIGGGSFRVEEYKKPEFEVTVTAPDKPIALGDKFTATVKAEYYFGAPVIDAKVKYKVMRSAYVERWYPIMPWDWLYGRGYGWLGVDYDWYPGWGRWGCIRPIPPWWGFNPGPPEVVSENEVAIGPDGTFKIEIDSAVAKELHGDQDHKYEITAEITDQSRRTIVGSGSVLAARQPFQITTWVNRGYYRVGDAIQAHVAAKTLDGKGVAGQGELELFQVTYDDQRQPIEQSVEKWQLATDSDGAATQQIEAAKAGQYRLVYRLVDASGKPIEGAFVFTVIGPGFDGAGFRFAELELTPDKTEYRPGDKVKLLINTDRVGSTVYLFVRPVNGIYQPPKVLRLKGKSAVEEIAIAQGDMPNIFVEAITISEGQLTQEVRQIYVPPEQRVMNLEVKPSAEKYRPGEKAQLEVKLTGLDGKPVVGSTVLTMYDKAVEYISGGSNVPEIKEFFWNWKRSHYPSTQSTLDRASGNLVPPGGKGMQNLGLFGDTVADWGVEAAYAMGGMGGGKMNFRQRAGREMHLGAMAEAPEAMPAAAPMEAMAADGAAGVRFNKTGGGGEAPAVQPTVRKNFADTAVWIAAVETNSDGIAKLDVDMPDSLTTWMIRAWSMGAGTRVGQGSAEAITTKNLLLRMQAPRFFVETDEVVLSANIHNYLPDKKSVSAVLELDGEALKPLGELTQTVEIVAGGEARVDWRVRASKEGEAVIRMKALTDVESDAAEMRFPVYVHGMLKTDSISGAIRPQGDRAEFTITVPDKRRVEATKLEIRYTPTLAGAMVDALPYLVNYPYGCTEQTLNRFLPTVITQQVLLKMKLNLKQIQEKRNNLNAQEIGDPAKRAEQWKRYDTNPVFDEAEVRKMTDAGLAALTDMQLSDGGWGWFSGWGENSSAHLTALVVHGLQVAKANDVALVPGVLERGVEWLKNYQAAELQKLNNADGKKEPYKTKADELDAFVYMVLVDAGLDEPAMREYLYRDRTDLAVYTQAMFGLALHTVGDAEKLAMVQQNLSQFVVQDAENQTAYLKLPDTGYWWFWYGSEYEAHAYYLKLLARTNPQSEVTSGLVKYLLNNRKHATYWNSTRDTALVVEAMSDYLAATKELEPNLTVELWIDGAKKHEQQITAENLFTFDNTFVLIGDALASGPHQVEFRKRGTGPLYFNAYLTNFALEDFITKAGLEVKVDRHYYRLIREAQQADVAGSRGQALQQRVEKYRREELPNLATVTSGDLIEIELVIDSKNDYEYLLFEDLKAAGFEPVEVRSGYSGNGLGAYMELRDNRVAFFVRQLARGQHSIAYRMRAEIPGKFSALPTRAEAMYAPELRANSDEIKLEIRDSQ